MLLGVFPLTLPACLLARLFSTTQPQRTKSDADESWEVKAEKGKVDAPPAGAAAAAAAAAAGGGAAPFANKDGSPAAAAAAQPALADDGRRRYTADFMKTLREANREHPGDMLQVSCLLNIIIVGFIMV